MHQRSMVMVCMVLVLAGFGCGGGGPAKKATFQASGKLTVDDKPMGPASLTLSATGGGKDDPSMSAEVKEDGTITFTTYGQSGYVAAGSYNVEMKGDIMSSKQVPATEPAKIDIKAGDKSIEIKLKSIPGGGTVGGLPMPNLNTP